MATFYFSLFISLLFNRHLWWSKAQNHLFHRVSYKTQELNKWTLFKGRSKAISPAFKSSTLPVPRAACHICGVTSTQAWPFSKRSDSVFIALLPTFEPERTWSTHSKGRNKTKMFHLSIGTKSPSHLKVKIHQEINKPVSNQGCPARQLREVLFQMRGKWPVIVSWTLSSGSSFKVEKKTRVHFMVRRTLFSPVDLGQVLAQYQHI